MVLQEKKVLITKHELVTGKKVGSVLTRLSRAGDAFLHEGDDHYVVKLAIFPFAFYMRKNGGGRPTYTLFAKRREIDGKIRLQDPIGRGNIVNDLTTHLEIRIPIFKVCLYMNLFPSH